LYIIKTAITGAFAVPPLLLLISLVSGFSTGRVSKPLELRTQTSLAFNSVINNNDGPLHLRRTSTQMKFATTTRKHQEHTRSDNPVMMKATSDGSSSTEYDVIVVGSGNGACALLKECLDNAPKDEDYKILVLEQGQNFFYTSDVTHENGWSKTYSSGKIFKLHNTSNRKGKAIIAGRAVTMGGGGR
jgi:chemotaxis response regulator CheB